MPLFWYFTFIVLRLAHPMRTKTGRVTRATHSHIEYLMISQMTSFYHPSVITLYGSLSTK
jgi:hypothetical protein